MKQTAVEWFASEIKGGQLITNQKFKELLEKAKEMEKEKSYTYDEIRTIAYNAYCLAQLDEPTEGKYNLWIQQYKK